MSNFDEYVASLADLDRREIIRQLISADSDAQRLAESVHREKRRKPAQSRAEQAGYDGERGERIIYFLMPAFLIFSVLLAFSVAGLEATAEGRTATAGVRKSPFPNLDIESGCRSRARYDAATTIPFDPCIKEERDAGEQLQKSWDSFPASMRERCLYLVTPPALPSYVSLQGCLTMAHDAEEFAKKDRTSP